MSTFAQKVIRFNRSLTFEGKLPKGIRIMNPFRENEGVLPVMEEFYNKFYNDQHPRKFILGINPGRFGAGTTGIPFTDTKRLAEFCSIYMDSVKTHEPSSVFVYEMIEKYGGVRRFYADYYINSLSPMGFLRKNNKGHWVNYNYYDDDTLYHHVKDFIVSSLKEQLRFGLNTDICFVLGKKNAMYLERINQEEKLFGSIVTLDHPRYIVQYKSKHKEDYMNDYLKKLGAS